MARACAYALVSTAIAGLGDACEKRRESKGKRGGNDLQTLHLLHLMQSLKIHQKRVNGALAASACKTPILLAACCSSDCAWRAALCALLLQLEITTTSAPSLTICNVLQAKSSPPWPLLVPRFLQPETLQPLRPSSLCVH